jgi:hypothetical protein
MVGPMGGDGSGDGYTLTIRITRRGLTQGAVAAVVATALIAGAYVLIGFLLPFFGFTDQGKARPDVQRWYDARWPGRVDVLGCAFTPQGDSDYTTYSCRTRVVCPVPVAFDVPAVLGVEPSSDPNPKGRKPVGPHC